MTRINTNTTTTAMNDKLVTIIERLENKLNDLRSLNDEYVNRVDIPHYENVLKGYVRCLAKHS